MLVRVTKEVADSPRWHATLDMVADLLERPFNPHSFDLTQYDEIANSAWLANPNAARASTLELIRKSARSINREISGDAVTVVIDERAPPYGESSNGTNLRIHPETAIELLTKPLHVIVEDRLSDGGFVLWMARLLGHDLIRKSYNARFLVFEHAGGKGQISRAAEVLSFGVWRREKPLLDLQLRAAVLLDSDADFPGHQPNVQIGANCEKFVAFVHILGRRTVENYVPKKYFRQRLGADGHAAMADAFFRMNDNQISHFPVKNGFRDRSRPPVPQSKQAFRSDVNRTAEQRALYEDLEEPDWDVLAVGFGERLASVYMEPAHRCQPGEPHLLTKDAHDELQRLLTRIAKYL